MDETDRKEGMKNGELGVTFGEHSTRILPLFGTARFAYSFAFADCFHCMLASDIGTATFRKQSVLVHRFAIGRNRDHENARS